MKNNKGITLLVLIVYIILIIMVLGILSVMTANFRKNLGNLDDASVKDVEFDKINLQLLKETKDSTNKLNKDDSQPHEIKFTNGNKYTYDSDTKTIYLNDNIKIAENIEECAFTIDESLETSPKQLYTDRAGDTVIVPAGFTVSEIPEEQIIDNGLVIYKDIPRISVQKLTVTLKILDQTRTTQYTLSSTEIVDKIDWEGTTTIASKAYPTVHVEYDQFVWVPVEKTYVTITELQEKNADIMVALQDLADSGIYPMAVKIDSTNYKGIIYKFSMENNEFKIKVENFSSTDDYSSATYLREPAYLSSVDATNSSITQNDLQAEYNNMINSIYVNGGFYVSRYELSYTRDLAIGETKRGKDLSVANSTNWYGLYSICQDMYKNELENVRTSMITGSQWSQIVLWMKDVPNINNNANTYIIDSNNMANYSTAKKTTGYSDNYSVKNIFDLAGNANEWTTEAFGLNARNVRGGNYSLTSNDGITYSLNVSPTNVSNIASTRATLYILD